MPEIEVPAAIAGAYTIYRTQGSPTTFKGPDLGIDIKDGSLIVTANGQVAYVFGPSQWLSVNFDPKTV
ncbi:hypothetical protein [Bradyrhizobium sp. LVM 105]|uniref:hypothetical protein n=1 Tax=Bradyrhizobium sp. LVM 105 TaxID=2341115 RepID=UPI000F8023DF|nr:hypothetical protein [Bradyrhizobium sp. LVM 105]RTE92456.1 hypothetical protein D6B98_13075 [Bradyrhizobium sp. LVM 105]